jgi:Tfp pilus assembly protein PilV
MPKKMKKKAGGITLVEVAIAIVLTGMLFLGSAVFRASTSESARQAEVASTAMRVIQCLTGAWQGMTDPNSFNPTTLSNCAAISVATATSGPGAPSGFTALGNYKVTADGVPYFVTLSWKNVTTATTNNGTVTLRALNANVGWQHAGQVITSAANADRTLTVSTQIYR